MGHTWAEATCTEPKTCTVCGLTEGEALGHSANEADCTEDSVCAVCGETVEKALGHTWAEATCTEPKTCTVCGLTEGKALGHSANEADCTEGSVCAVCGETVEKALGHDWAEATCTEPKTCTKCGKTEGEPTGHDWTEATYEAAKTCTVCGLTEGEPKSPFFYIKKKDGVTITGCAIVCEPDLEIPAEIDGKPVTGIGKNAFSGRNEIVRVTMPESIAVIEDYAFKDCKNLEYVYMPSGETAEFDHTTFYNCSKLMHVDTGRIKYTGFTDNIGRIDGEWTTNRDISLRGVNTNIYELYEPVTDCVGFSIDVAIVEYTGNPFGKWYVYARDLSGKWGIIAEYVMEKEQAGQFQSFTFDMSEPVTFDALTIVEEQNVYHSVSSQIDFYNVICHFTIDGK